MIEHQRDHSLVVGSNCDDVHSTGYFFLRWVRLPLHAAMEPAQSVMNKKHSVIKTTIVETKQLLEIYYSGLSRKQGWEAVISDDFKFVGGDMTKNTPIVGKANYIAIIDRFSRLFAR